MDKKTWEMCTTVGRAVGRSFPMVDAGDVVQELALWCLTHEVTVDKYLHDTDDPDLAEKKLGKTLRNEALKFCHVEQASRVGYNVDDVHFYTVAQLRELIPLVFDYDAWFTTTLPEGARVTGGGLVNEGNNLVVMLADVSRGVGALSPSDQELVQLKGQGFTDDELSIAWAVEAAAVNQRYDRALARLRKVLGGEKPRWDGPGTRKAMTNGAAQAITGDLT